MTTKSTPDTPETLSKYVIAWLDNVQRFVDRTSEEVAKADVAGANRRMVDTAIETTKDTVGHVADAAARGDALASVRALTAGTLDGWKEAVRVAGEESQRINLLECSSKVVQEGLDMMRRQIDLGLEYSSAVGDAVRNGEALKPPSAKAPGARVTFEPGAGTPAPSAAKR